MEFYIFIFAFAVLAMVASNHIENEKTKKVMVVAMFVILTLVSGTRFELGGSDYYIYRDGFEAVPKLWNIKDLQSSVSNLRLVNAFEPGYMWFNSLVKTLGFNFYGFTLIESIIWFICMYIGLKRYVSDWTIVIVVFLYKLYFYNTFISLRQSITIGLFFVAMRFIQEKKWIQYYIICCIAMLFHNAAILLFVLYPILQFKITKRRLLILNVVCWVLFLFEKIGLSIFDIITYVLSYVNSTSTIIVKAKQWLSMGIDLSIFHILEYMLLMLLVILFYEKIVEIDENAEFVLKVFLILLPIFSICSGNVVSTRFKDFFTITYGIIIMYLCKIDNGRIKWMVQLGTVIICVYGYIRYLTNFDAGGLLPYISYISKGIGIFE